MNKYFLFVLLTMVLVGCEQPTPDVSSGDDGDSTNMVSAVVTGDVKNITHQSAILYGEVNVEIVDYESIEWGMIYSSNKAELESRNCQYVYSTAPLRDSVYSVSLGGLDAETKYYYCAFVYLNGKQYKFGETKEFITLVAPGVDEITILTGSAEEITNCSVVLFGEFKTDISNYTSFKYGISYSTNKNDLQANGANLVYSTASSQGNSYSVSLSGLDSQTQYYYCAFVYVNEKDYKYGDIKSFTTLNGIAVFSVSATEQVTFSPGNLQWHTDKNLWQFAAKQTDYIGEAYSLYPSGWIDLFRWGKGDNPYETSLSNEDYTTFVDWGTNKIGDDAPNTWRTLSSYEWDYIFRIRPNAKSLFALGSVNGINGTIILPDNWTTPQGVTFIASSKKGLYWDGHCYENDNANNFSHNTYTSEQWSKMEQAGAVFLPASGFTPGKETETVGWDSNDHGYYWSSCKGRGVYEKDYAYSMRFTWEELYPKDYWHPRSYCLSVRLVKDL